MDLSQKDKKMKKRLLISLLVAGLMGTVAMFAMEGESAYESEYSTQRENQKKLESARDVLEAKQAELAKKGRELSVGEELQLDKMREVARKNAERLVDAKNNLKELLKVEEAKSALEKAMAIHSSDGSSFVTNTNDHMLHADIARFSGRAENSLNQAQKSFDSVKEIVAKVEKKLGDMESDSESTDDKLSDQKVVDIKKRLEGTLFDSGKRQMWKPLPDLFDPVESGEAKDPRLESVKREWLSQMDILDSAETEWLRLDKMRDSERTVDETQRMNKLHKGVVKVYDLLQKSEPYVFDAMRQRITGESRNSYLDKADPILKNSREKLSRYVNSNTILTNENLYGRRVGKVFNMLDGLKRRVGSILS